MSENGEGFCHGFWNEKPLRRYVNTTIINESEIGKNEIDMDNVINSKIQWLVRGSLGFHICKITMGEYGEIPIHFDDYENKKYVYEGGYVLEGRGIIVALDKEMEVSKGDAFHIDASLPHGFRNKESEDFIFICLIPIG